MRQGEAEDILTKAIIGSALSIHRALGPGLLESAYESILAHELRKTGLVVKQQPAVPIGYDGVSLDLGFRPDLVVEGAVIIEVKAIQKLLAVHEAQILSYLRFANVERGLLINFHSYPLRDGIRRFSLTKTKAPFSANSAYLGDLGGK